MFLESVIPSADQTIIFEMLAYAAHNPRFRRSQEKHTRTTMAYLVNLLDQAPASLQSYYGRLKGRPAFQRAKAAQNTAATEKGVPPPLPPEESRSA
jgi:hypothetical protein